MIKLLLLQESMRKNKVDGSPSGYLKVFQENKKKWELLEILKSNQPIIDLAEQFKWLSCANPAQTLDKLEFKIKTEGNWRSMLQKPDIILTYDKNLYATHSSELEEVSIINKADLFQFKTNWHEEEKKKNVGFIVSLTVWCVDAVVIIVDHTSNLFLKLL